MVAFWIAAALMLAIALGVMLPPLLGRGRRRDVSRESLNLAIYQERLAELERDGAEDPEELKEARDDLARELLEDTRGGSTGHGTVTGAWGPVGASIVVVAVPLLAITLYLVLGNQQGILASGPQQASLPSDHPAVNPAGGADSRLPSLDQLAQRLAAKLEREPDDLEGWVMLGRTYVVMERHDLALSAYERAYRISADNPDVLAGYAEAIAMGNDGDLLAGRAPELLEAALRSEPQHQKALWLAGGAAFQGGDYAAAIRHWETLASLQVPESEDARLLQGYLNEARARRDGAPSSTQAIAGNADAAVSQQGSEVADRQAEDPASSVQVNVSLAPSIAEKASPGDAVFIFARAAEGPRMPLAIVRRTVRELPVDVVLDDSMAMSPGMALSSFPNVVIGARVSKSGNALPQAGDLEGLSAPVPSSSADRVDVRIDRVL